MKTKILASILLFYIFDVNAKIIYIEPVLNAKYVSINNTIILGFDETIISSNLNSLISVTGSLSGNHTGEIILTSDKKKLIFKSHRQFSFNEKVEVRLNVLKTSSTSDNRLTYIFQTQMNKPEWDYRKHLMDEYGYSFENSTDAATLPQITVSVSNNPSPGHLFLSNFPFTNIPNTPYLIISDNTGTPYSYKELNTRALDFKVQPNGYLTYAKWKQNFYAVDNNYNLIDSFYCGNGYSTDHHELIILDNGHALLMSYDPQIVDMSQIVSKGDSNAIVIGLIIQEIDVNKNVVFQWRSWDHIAITDAEHIDLTANIIDYVHGNAIEPDNDGNLLISSRHLSEITKIDRTTGDIIWRLGGVGNEFDFTNDTIGFSYQHDIRRIPNGNITLFDNGNFHTPSFSRAVEYQLDEINKTATLVWQYRKTPDVYGLAMGSAQRLSNGNTLISWGSTNPTVTEVTPAGNIALEMTLPANIFTYRTFKHDLDITLNVTLAIEGLYNVHSGKLSINDTLKIHLRNVNSPYNIIDSSISVIDSVNLQVSAEFYNTSSGTYYFSIIHRNSIETWSKDGGESFVQGSISNYNFTDSNFKAYGHNLVRKGSKYCIYSGDVNQDGFIDVNDAGRIDNDLLIFAKGYRVTDLNGDGFVDFSDAVIADNNGYNFIGAVTP